MHALEHLSIPDAVSLLAVPTQHTYSDAVNKRFNLKSYCEIEGIINLTEYTLKILTFWYWMRLYQLLYKARVALRRNSNLNDYSVEEWLFLRKAGMVISVMYLVPKSEKY
nr:2498_t:CDS:2 [Entrophospora candida]